MNRQKIIFFAAELLAVALLRAVMIAQRERKVLPRGGKVGKIKGRSVFRFPTFKRAAQESGHELKPEPVPDPVWTPPVAEPKDSE